MLPEDVDSTCHQKELDWGSSIEALQILYCGDTATGVSVDPAVCYLFPSGPIVPYKPSSLLICVFACDFFRIIVISLTFFYFVGKNSLRH